MVQGRYGRPSSTAGGIPKKKNSFLCVFLIFIQKKLIFCQYHPRIHGEKTQKALKYKRPFFQVLIFHLTSDKSQVSAHRLSVLDGSQSHSVQNNRIPYQRNNCAVRHIRATSVSSGHLASPISSIALCVTVVPGHSSSTVMAGAGILVVPRSSRTRIALFSRLIWQYSRYKKVSRSSIIWGSACKSGHSIPGILPMSIPQSHDGQHTLSKCLSAPNSFHQGLTETHLVCYCKYAVKCHGKQCDRMFSFTTFVKPLPLTADNYNFLRIHRKPVSLTPVKQPLGLVFRRNMCMHRPSLFILIC